MSPVGGHGREVLETHVSQSGLSPYIAATHLAGEVNRAVVLTDDPSLYVEQVRGGDVVT